MGGLAWGLAAIFGFGGTGAAILLWAFQFLVYLKTGNYPAIPTYYAFAYFDISPVLFPGWIGVQKIIADILDQPLSLVLFCTGVAIASIFASIASRIEKWEWEQHKKQLAQKRIQERNFR